MKDWLNIKSNIRGINYDLIMKLNSFYEKEDIKWLDIPTNISGINYDIILKLKKNYELDNIIQLEPPYKNRCSFCTKYAAHMHIKTQKYYCWLHVINTTS